MGMKKKRKGTLFKCQIYQALCLPLLVTLQIKTGVPGEKPLRAEKKFNKLNPHMTLSLGIEPGPQWWEASAITTMPPLLFQTNRIQIQNKQNPKLLFPAQLS